jgi:1,2-diacylglycerol 3-alpha-glucosyltransferase
MRIGLFTDAYFPVISGVTISVRTLRDELVKLGHEVFIICNDNSKAEKEHNVIRIKGYKLPMKGMEEFRIGKVQKKHLQRLAFLNLDIVHCHTEFMMGRMGRKLAKVYNIPIVHTYHTMYEDYIHFITKTFYRTLKFASKVYSRKFAESADEVVFPTVKVQRTFESYGFKKQAHLIPTGIYLDRFSKGQVHTKDMIQLKESLNIRHNDFVMLFLGRISREKSIEKLIREFAKIDKKNKKLLIVGGGPDKEYFESIVQELKITDNVIFTGMIDPTQVAKYYHISDLFVNFSMTETQGLTYIEALASCVPLLVKWDDNLEGVLEHGVNGYAFTIDSEFVSLAEKIISNVKLQEELKKKACYAIDKFSAQQYALSIEKIYKDLNKQSQ